MSNIESSMIDSEVALEELKKLLETIKKLDLYDEAPREWVDGIPPVGTECEASWLVPPDGGDTGWVQGKFKGGYDSKVWFGTDEFEEVVIPAHNIVFRPIKSQGEAGVEDAVQKCEWLVFDDNMGDYHVVWCLFDDNSVELCGTEYDEDDDNYFVYPATRPGFTWGNKMPIKYIGIDMPEAPKKDDQEAAKSEILGILSTPTSDDEIVADMLLEWHLTQDKAL